MSVGEALTADLNIKTVFSINIGSLTLPVTETVVVTWCAMAAIIVLALLARARLKTVPVGAQCLTEGAVEFLNTFSREQFGKYAPLFAPYIGTVFIFLLVANILPSFGPVDFFGFGDGIAPLAPPTRDINLTAALALITIVLVLVSGIAVRGPGGWAKTLFAPVPLMLPFNLLEYIIKPLSLCLRLFGNILGSYIIMRLIEHALAAALHTSLVIPLIPSLYFDFFDGFIQALVFTFLSTLYVHEAIAVDE